MPAVARLQHDRALAAIQHQPGDADHAGRLHGVADDRESLLADGVGRHEIVRPVVPDPLDRRARHEHVDVDGVRALQGDLVDLVVLQHHISVVAALVAFDLVVLVDRLAGQGVDIAALHPVARRPVEGVEADLLARARGRHHRDRARHERELEIAFPERARRHSWRSNRRAISKPRLSRVVPPRCRPRPAISDAEKWAPGRWSGTPMASLWLLVGRTGQGGRDAPTGGGGSGGRPSCRAGPRHRRGRLGRVAPQ